MIASGLFPPALIQFSFYFTVEDHKQVIQNNSFHITSPAFAFQFW